jgi:hypothetical protein
MAYVAEAFCGAQSEPDGALAKNFWISGQTKTSLARGRDASNPL